jgi:dTDP-glucose 4,6-dehydratase
LDYVLHFAAETHVDRSMVDPLPFVESNVLGTYNLLEYCRHKQPRLKMFFLVSTDEVYGPAPPGVDHDEGCPHRPSNPYSATKAAAEDLAYAWDHCMGVPVIITNTMNNIGPMQHPEKYVPKIIRAILRRDIITVHGSPDSPGSRKYLYARDHADAINFLISNGRRGERYNVVGTEEINNLEMVRRIEGILDREAKIRFVDFHSVRPGHDKRYALSGEKMRELGWVPPTPINDALERIVRWTLENPRWIW